MNDARPPKKPELPSPGRVALVGGGPGDPSLITVRGRRLLEEADAVVHDALVGPGLLQWVRPDCVLHPVGKRCGKACTAQSEIEALLIRLAREGLTVVRLKGGDPFIFGRGGEEAQALQAAGIPVEIVPGVTAALGAAACAGIPLTHRGHSSAVVFLTGHEDPAKPDATVHWEDYARLNATLCVYMGARNLEVIAQRLLAGGMDPATPAAAIHAATTGEHRQIQATVAQLTDAVRRAGLDSPLMVIIGSVAAFADRLSWFADRHAQGQNPGGPAGEQAPDGASAPKPVLETAAFLR